MRVVGARVLDEVEVGSVGAVVKDRSAHARSGADKRGRSHAKVSETHVGVFEGARRWGKVRPRIALARGGWIGVGVGRAPSPYYGAGTPGIACGGSDGVKAVSACRRAPHQKSC